MAGVNGLYKYNMRMIDGGNDMPVVLVGVGSVVVYDNDLGIVMFDCNR